jgi:hypothetical protein
MVTNRLLRWLLSAFRAMAMLRGFSLPLGDRRRSRLVGRKKERNCSLPGRGGGTQIREKMDALDTLQEEATGVASEVRMAGSCCVW